MIPYTLEDSRVSGRESLEIPSQTFPSSDRCTKAYQRTFLGVTSQMKTESHISSISLRTKGFRLLNAIGLISSFHFIFLNVKIVMLYLSWTILSERVYPWI